MKKVLSFCVLSMLLAVLSLGLKAQSGLVLDPSNMPDVVLNQYDTIYISANSECFDSLGLAANDRVSIEWKVLYNGSVIPEDSLSYYFEDFKFESRYDLGMAEKWWGSSYTSHYCQNGDGYGSYPGANTPTGNLELGQQCEDPGHFIISLPGQNNPYQFDFFYVRWFKDETAAVPHRHRLVYNIKVDGEYEIIFTLARRCGGTEWDQIYVGRDERYKVGGHMSVVCDTLSSDTLHSYAEPDIVDYYRCVGDSLVLGNPAVTFKVSTDTTVDPGYDSVLYMGASSCNGAIDSIVRFRVFFEDPSVPVLDTLNSTLVLCDSGQVSIAVTTTAADKCIWLDGTFAVLDTLDASTAFTKQVNANTQFYVLGFNSVSGCVSSDTLDVYVEVYASPNPVVSAVEDTICENGVLKISLDNGFDGWTWFHNGTDMNLDTLVYDVADAALTDAGLYWAVVSENHVHSVYPTIDTIACSAADSVEITVFERPSVEWATLDGNIVTDSLTFCPNDLEHVIVATISGGQAPYDNVHWTGTAGTETYNADKSSDTLTLILANTCGTEYAVGIDYAVDANGCTLKDTINLTFFVNDTVKPTITHNSDTVSAPSYANCEYIIPDVVSLIVTDDNCGIADTVQVPAAGQLVTTDTIVVVTVTDLCGNTASDTIEVRLPVDPLAVDTIVVTQTVLCAGDANGAFQITIEGGTAPYDVHIVSADVADSVYDQHGNQTIFTFDGLISGKWDITVTDTNGCQVTDTVNVAAPDVLTLTSSDWTNLTCFESNDGSFKFNVRQGTLPYDVTIVRTLGANTETQTMTLNPSVLDTTITMNDQKAGIYVITVVDGNNCTASVTDTLTQPDELVLVGDTVLNHVKCFGESNGNLAVTEVTGGTYPYYYAWVNEAGDTVSTDSVTGRILPAGAYTIYITDANNCTPNQVLTDTIKQPEKALNVVSVNAPVSDTCPRLRTYTFDATVEGGRPEYEFEWTFNNDIASQAHYNATGAVADTFVYYERTISCDTTFEIIFKVTDDSACVAMDTIYFTIADTIAPTLAGMLDTLYIDGCEAADAGDTLNTIAKLQAAGLTISDNCTDVDALTVNFSEVVTPGCPIEVVRTYSVTDSCGLTSDELKHVIYVQDTTVPVFTCPDDTILYLSDACTVDTVSANVGEPINVSDNCSTNLTISHRDVVVAGCGSSYTISRYWKVVDECGNGANSESLQTIQVQDTTPPVFTTLPVNDTIACDGAGNTYDIMDYESTLAGAVATDNCAFDSIAMVRDSVVDGCNSATKTYYYTFTAVDLCGNNTSVNATLNIIDTVAPYFTRHAPDIEVECDAANLQLILDQWRDTVRYEDGCSDNVEVRDSLSPFIADPVCGGYYTRFWTLDDGCNTTVESHRLTIVDNSTPYFTVLPTANPVAECDGAGNHADLFEWLNMPRAVDACSGPVDTLNLYFYNGTTYEKFDTTAAGLLADGIHFKGWTELAGSCNGYYEIFWEALDSCGNGSIYSLNPATTTERFYIKDEEGPVFPVVRTDTTVHCGFDPADLTAWLTISDAFDTCSRSNYTVAHTETFNPSCGVTGVYDVEWTATDDCGNTTTHRATWTIIDTVAPEITTNNVGGVADTLYLYFHDDADDLGDFDHPVPTATTGLTATTSPDFVTDFLANNDAGITDITDCGYLKDYRYRNLRQDEPANDECSAYWLIDHVFNDACNKEFTLTQNIIVLDTTAPRVNDIADDMYFFGPDNGCAKEPVDTFRTIGELNSYAPNRSAAANAADLHLSTTNSNYIRLISSVTSGDASDLCDSIEVRTYEISDSCGNTTTFTHTIYFHDTIAPVLALTEMVDTIHQEGAGNCDSYSEIADENLYNNLLDETWLTNRYNGFSIEDCHNYTIEFVSETESTNDAYCPGKVFVRKYKVADVCGTPNASYFTVRLIVKDTIAPQVAATTILRDTTIYSDNDCQFTLPALGFTDYKQLRDWQGAEVYNDCNLGETGNVTNCDTLIGGTGCDSTFTFRYVAADSCGNISKDTVTILVHVLDTLAPNVTVAQATVVDTQYYELNCDIPTLNYWSNGQDALDRGVEMTDCNPAWDDNSKLVRLDETSERDVCTTIYTVRYQVKDACSDRVSDTIYQTIVILDTVAPLVTTDVLKDTLIYMVDDAADCWGPEVPYFTTVGEVMAYDNAFNVVDCNVGDNSVVRLVGEDSSAIQCVRTVVRTYVVVDSCGLVSNEFTQRINVSDTVAPAITASLEPQQVYMDADCDFTYTTYATVADLPTDMQNGINDCNLKDELIIESIDTLENGGTDCNKAFTVYVNYKAQDSCGNMAVFVDTIYVADTVAPAIAGHLDTLTIYLTEGCTYTVPAAYTSVDALPAGITVTDCKLMKDLTVSDVDTLTGYCPMLIHRTYTVSDSCGHTSTFGEFFNVTDTFAPKVTDNTLDTLTVYIAQDSTYTVPAAYTTVTELLANGAALTDCNMIDGIHSVQADTTLNPAACDGSFVLRQYVAIDSCDNVSDPIYEHINLVDTVAPWLDVTLPDYDAERTATACEFLVPNLHDTIAAHYVDNWSAFTDYNQIPAAGYAITNFRDTVVMVAFGDVCGNMDTVYVNINVPDTLKITSLTKVESRCYGQDSAYIAIEISGGMADYVYNYHSSVYDSTHTITAMTDTLFNITAAFCTITVTDANGCVATDTTMVNQPDDVVLTPYVSNTELCFNDNMEVAIQMAGGVPNYNDITATVLGSDYSARTSVIDTTNIVSLTDTISIEPVDLNIVPSQGDTIYIAFAGEDSHGCKKMDTSMVVVHPIYLTEQYDRRCYQTLVSEGGYYWVGVAGDTIGFYPTSHFADAVDSVYEFNINPKTIYNCDSITIMYLEVTNNPYLKARKAPADNLHNDSDPLADAVERELYDTLHNAEMRWEIFVDKNCTNCPNNEKVSIEYEYYRKNGDTYERMDEGVSNYFFPQYRTYYDNKPMTWYPAPSSAVTSNVPTVDIPSFYGTYSSDIQYLNYYNLCWLTPDYDVPCLQTYYSQYNNISTNGYFYENGRAHSIRLSQFRQGGDYKIVVKLLKRTGGYQMNQFTTFSGCMGYNKPGGQESTVAGEYDVLEIFFHVEDSMIVVQKLPEPIAPIGGSVVYSSNNENPQANVYPNPARDYITVEFTGFEGQTRVMLSNTNGKNLKNIELDIDDVHTTNIVKMETGNYAQGVYLITVRNNDAIITKRVVIIR